MTENTFTQVYTQDMVDQVTAKLAEIRAIFPGLITLTPDERLTYAKMGERSSPFVQKAIDYASRNAAFVPVYVNLPLMETDLQSAKFLLQVSNQINELQNTIDDTMMVAGSESLTAALSIYKNIQQAATHGMAGAQEAADDLSTRFPHKTATAPTSVPPATK